VTYHVQCTLAFVSQQPESNGLISTERVAVLRLTVQKVHCRYSFVRWCAGMRMGG
jgi:hypothetical protein